MQAEPQTFRISTGLKDLIGRDLITDDFVAVFELVKNSFDAHATSVVITFAQDEITIADNGKGMGREDILQKWLFVAYSAKRQGVEDENYRDRIGQRSRPYAGAKGVGRFSCDRLGAELQLVSRSKDGAVQVLDVDWRRYEVDAQKEFDEVQVDLGTTDAFPGDVRRPTSATGTILRIKELRSVWSREQLQRLKRELTKLIDPFVDSHTSFGIEIVADAEIAADDVDAVWNAQRRDDQSVKLLVNGPIENPMTEVLRKRTTVIHVKLIDGGKWLVSTLEDRGDVVYKIREPNPYFLLNESNLSADVFFLNRSAKVVFAHRMGVPSVEYGSIFVFRNGFRVFPIGAEDDDFFGLNRRKQQGQKRFLGGRDLIGRVEVSGVEGFDEATSRSHGLIATPHVEELISCIRDKCVRRLERYVVDISWKDTFDKEVENTSRMRRDESSALVSQLVSRLAASEGVELLEYNPDLVRIVDEKSEAFETSLKALELLADRTGDKALQERVAQARVRIKALEEAEAEAREAERRADLRAAAAENVAAVATLRYDHEKERNAFLVAAGSLDQDTILNLHHQIIMHASDVQQGIKRMMGRLRNGAALTKDEWVEFLEQVSFRNSQILTAARFATKGGYKQQSSESNADLSVYIRDYIETISTLWAPRGIQVAVEADGKPLVRRFRPIEVGIVIDNLVSNAAKAGATAVGFLLTTTKGAKPTLELDVADDGDGWPDALDPPSRAFEKGTTTTDGSGLGLYHVRQVVEGLGGTIEVADEPLSDDLGRRALDDQVSVMRLDFKLLVVDDNPDTIGNSVQSLRDHLSANGFMLEVKIATGDNLSRAGLRRLARQYGKEFNLVAVDYNLGSVEVDGAQAAQQLRTRMRYTDMIFYSSVPGISLLSKLAENDVAGVFISTRDDLDAALKGLADTVIGKAVDLNHMRGIAMAEVADMDVMMEEVLEKIFSCSDPAVAKLAQRTLDRLLEGGKNGLRRLEEVVAEGKVLAILPNTELFGSGKRFQAINRIVSVLKEKPTDALRTFGTFERDIIANRNTLAHAKEELAADGTVTLRSARRGAEPIVINDTWMVDFRGKLRVQRQALVEICSALERHATDFVSE